MLFVKYIFYFEPQRQGYRELHGFLPRRQKDSMEHKDIANILSMPPKRQKHKESLPRKHRITEYNYPHALGFELYALGSPTASTYNLKRKTSHYSVLSSKGLKRTT